MVGSKSLLPEYQVYQMAKQRCTNPNNQRWYTHGARGIKFLFNSFAEFYAEIGPRPSSAFSLERKDNDGNYEIGNVKWATRSEQQRNKRPYTHIIRRGKGYNWHKASQKRIVRIKYMGKTFYLGTFVKEKDAKKKYETAKRQLLKEKR